MTSQQITKQKKVMNLLGIEMVLLTLGIIILCYIIMNIIGNILIIMTDLKNGNSWNWNVALCVILLTIGILLIIISQNI
jgi:hypothetical protein